MLLRFVKGVGDCGVCAFRLPLLCPGWALRELPLVFEEVIEEEIAPLRRRLRPRYFRTTGDRVGADAGAVLAFPTTALVLDGAAFRLRADQRRMARAVGLAERVTAGDQCDGLFIVHRHAEECLANILGRRDPIGMCGGTIAVYLAKTH